MYLHRTVTFSLTAIAAANRQQDLFNKGYGEEVRRGEQTTKVFFFLSLLRVFLRGCRVTARHCRRRPDVTGFESDM